MRIAAAVIAATALAGSAGYEDLPRRRASELLPPELLSGPHHRVEEVVGSDGFRDHYEIASDFGRFEVTGRYQLQVRVHELGAIARLVEASGAEVAAVAAGESLAEVGRSVATAVEEPKETARGVGRGVKRFFGRLGRSVRRTGEKVQEAAQDDDAPSEEPQRTRGEAVGQAAKGLGHRVLGVSSAERRWAREVGVDPYTTNPALRRELERVARWEAGGRITRGVLIPLPALVGRAADVSDLVWESDPDTLTTLNEKRLEEMGARGEASRELRLNGHYTLTGLTLVVSSLHALTGVPGRDDFVLRAGRVSSEDQAISHVESALLVRQFHEQQAPVTSVLSGGPGITVLTADERLVQLLPVEHVVWSEEIETYADEMAWRRRQHPERKAEVWLTGSASERTQRELDRRGWVLRQGALATALPEPAAARP